MAVFRVVMATAVILGGLVDFVAGSPLWLWRTERKRGPDCAAGVSTPCRWDIPARLPLGQGRLWRFYA